MTDSKSKARLSSSSTRIARIISGVIVSIVALSFDILGMAQAQRINIDGN